MECITLSEGQDQEALLWDMGEEFGGDWMNVGDDDDEFVAVESQNCRKVNLAVGKMKAKPGQAG